MIIREREPLNLEYPFDELTDFISSGNLFYVRSHFPAPDISESSYKLRVAGAVQHPLAFTLDELRAMPSDTIAATLECAGNSRVFLIPQENGAQWELGAVGTAEWTGVRLSTLLQLAGMEPDAWKLCSKVAIVVYRRRSQSLRSRSRLHAAFPLRKPSLPRS